MKTKAGRIFVVIKVLTWTLFIGLCIKTGAILYSFFVSLFINPMAAKNLHLGLNLYELMNFNKSYFISIVSLIIIIWGLKAFMFYLITNITLKINLEHPFSDEVAKLILWISYVACAIGLLTTLTSSYTEWISKKGVSLNNLYEYVSGGPEFLFMAGIIFVIAQVFKRGIELQSENQLTI